MDREQNFAYDITDQTPFQQLELRVEETIQKENTRLTGGNQTKIIFFYSKIAKYRLGIQ